MWSMSALYDDAVTEKSSGQSGRRAGRFPMELTGRRRGLRTFFSRLQFHTAKGVES